MAKCSKCENDSFQVVTLENKSYCVVQCSECETAIGVLEDIDFKVAHNAIKEKVQLAINNTVGLERLINIRTNEIKSELNKVNDLQDKIDYILSVSERLNKKIN
ncbi:hypothetical protein JMN23_16830 [Bacillus sp. RHFB]|nr:hypothetical protein [Bacillus sp. RHFB]